MLLRHTLYFDGVTQVSAPYWAAYIMHKSNICILLNFIEWNNYGMADLSYITAWFLPPNYITYGGSTYKKNLISDNTHKII